MILMNQLSMAYGERLLFYDVSLNLSGQKHYALVGANGAGKSTLLKLLMGEEEPTAGSITIPKDCSVGWLKQDQFRYENTLITDIVLQGKPALWEAMQKKNALLMSTEWDDHHMMALSEMEEIIAHLDGYSALAFAEKLLIGLGISLADHQKPLSALSGGYKLRVLFAQALFQDPDILLLDEPTNHLDIISIHWLERYLKNEFRGMVLFISHDVSFIDRLADNILDIDYGEIRQYSGKYEKFVAEKQLIEAQKLQTKKQAEQKIADMQSFVDRFRAKASKARQAQSRMKAIEKMEIPDIKQSSRLSPHFRFEQNRPAAKCVLTVKNLGKQFQEKILFQRLHFRVSRGEKIAIMGENGIGKSTLIKILKGQLVPDQGEYTWGVETHIDYFSQDHHEGLNTHLSVLQWLTQETSNSTEQQIRKTLGQVLFTKDDVEKDVLTLSGGEAARLLLARMMRQPANVLILDEPTNHLDIEATEALAAALKQYPGTVIFVSHNRDFVSKIAGRILFISREKGVEDFQGTFSDFEKMHDV